jgi:isovaleryl-CoA dehydrogenase
MTARSASTSRCFESSAPLGLLGITVPERFGGAGMDAVAAVIAHEELAASDPGFCLSYLAHAMLFANNLAHNGDDAQRARLPAAGLLAASSSAAWA